MRWELKWGRLNNKVRAIADWDDKKGHGFQIAYAKLRIVLHASIVNIAANTSNLMDNDHGAKF